MRPEWNSPLTTFEAPDPEYWVRHGYAIVLADIPGTWYWEGPATYLSPEEARAYADLIEWAGTQPWSNGRVGLSGVSYLTQTQWRVAAFNPPHLAAINPWEGWTDTYREVVRHGGIPETFFWPYIWDRWGAGTGMIERTEVIMIRTVADRLPMSWFRDRLETIAPSRGSAGGDPGASNTVNP